MNLAPTPDQLLIGKSVAAALGSQPHIYPFFDESNQYMVRILSVYDPLNTDVKFYCTVGLSDAPNLIEMRDTGSLNIPVELLIAGYQSFDKLPHLLSTLAFYIIKDKWNCQPGSIYKNMLNLYEIDTVLKHVLFTRPFPWPDKLEPMPLSNKVVHFLFCVPVSDAECAYGEANGGAELERLLMEKGIDYLDLARPSVL